MPCVNLYFSPRCHTSLVSVSRICTVPHPSFLTLLCPLGALLHHRRCQRRNHRCSWERRACNGDWDSSRAYAWLRLHTVEGVHV